jgi:hypothetical protein
MCKQGEAEGVVISIGANTFSRAAFLVGQDDDTTGQSQKILAQIGSFSIGSSSLLKFSSSMPASGTTVVASTHVVQCVTLPSQRHDNHCAPLASYECSKPG